MSNAKPLDVMKLPELKKRVRYTWSILNSWTDGMVLQPENFDKEMKAFGDRRYKKTWIKALCKFEAMFAYESCLDSWSLLTVSFAFRPERWDYEYRHQIFEEFLLYPDALELIKSGLEDLFDKDFDVKERNKADDFFGLLEEREGGHRAIGITAGLAREFPRVSAAA